MHVYNRSPRERVLRNLLLHEMSVRSIQNDGLDEMAENRNSSDEPHLKKRRGTRTNSSISNNNNYDIQMSQEICDACGFLEWVTVKNFMCHDHLAFNFPSNSNINFVKGRNGSGKSAILTAVVVGLGGTTRSTNRGNSLKELVKYGKQTATVEIGIKNTGRDAFRHELYGDTIIVERKIQAAGGGGYKIKAANGTVVSSKKDDIHKMLDHFNLQVDNPITVLNQDNSRAFLNSTDPQEMYKFFLKATQLQQMKDDYNHLEKILKTSFDIIQTRKECLPLLQKELETQRVQYEFCVTLNDKREKLRELRRELAWAMIIQAEKIESDAQKEVEAQKKMIGKNLEKINQFQSKYENEQQLHKQSQEEFNRVTNELMAHTQQVKQSNAAVISAKKIFKDRQTQSFSAERKVKSTKKEISVLKAAIAKDNDVLQSKWAVQHTLWSEKMKRIRSEMETVEQDMRTEDGHHLNIQNTLAVKKSNLSQTLLEEKAIKRHQCELEQELQGLIRQQDNQFTVYGQWVPQLLQEIETAHKKGLFSKKPVGPLGAFIKLQDKQWGHVAEMVIGNKISAFCVDNQNDDKVLRQLMKKVKFGRQPQPTVIMSRFREQVHDVSRFEVKSERYQSLWSVLNISTTEVANTLIDQMQVESTLLIPTAQEAGCILKNKATVPQNCRVAYTLNRDTYFPDPEFRLYSGRGQQPARFLQVSVEQKVGDLSAELKKVNEQLQVLNQEMQKSKQNIQRLENEVKVSTRKLQSSKVKMDKLRLQYVNLKNQEEPAPPDVSQLEEDVKQQEVLLKEAESNLEMIKEEVVKSEAAFTTVSSEFEKLKNDEKLLLENAQNKKDKLDLLEERVNNLLQTVDAYRKKGKEYLQNKKKVEQRLKAASETLRKELQGAKQFQPRVNTVRSVAEVQRQYNGLQDRLNKEAAQRGDPLAVAEKYKNTKKRFTVVSGEIESHTSLIKIIEDSLKMRLDRFKHFRKLISIMVKTNFKSNLAHRNLEGCLNFDFEKKTLSLSVTKMGNENVSASGNVTNHGRQIRKPVHPYTLAMMSGGERSFATVSLLLALWEVLESPVRILDEFDVFMDIVARRQSMGLMIKGAKSKTQYIYLTPLELDLSLHSNIHIFVMPDPERQRAVT